MAEFTTTDDSEFNRLVDEALHASFEGWDFSFIRNRMIESEPPWDYRAIVNQKLKNAESVVDMGTGGGEFIASLPQLPLRVYATEQYEPNVAVARARLQPLGIEVFYLEEEAEPPFNRQIPLESDSVDVVLNRHEAYTPSEIRRVLQPEGSFVTQQVGSLNEITLKQFFDQDSVRVGNWNLESAVLEIEENGMAVDYADEFIGTVRFTDIGSIVYFLKAVPWLVEDFSVERQKERLRRMHERIATRGYFETVMHRFILAAHKN